MLAWFYYLEGRRLTVGNYTWLFYCGVIDIRVRRVLLWGRFGYCRVFRSFYVFDVRSIFYREFKKVFRRCLMFFWGNDGVVIRRNGAVWLRDF